MRVRVRVIHYFESICKGGEGGNRRGAVRMSQLVVHVGMFSFTNNVSERSGMTSYGHIIVTDNRDPHPL